MQYLFYINRHLNTAIHWRSSVIGIRHKQQFVSFQFKFFEDRCVIFKISFCIPMERQTDGCVNMAELKFSTGLRNHKKHKSVCLYNSIVIRWLGLRNLHCKTIEKRMLGVYKGANWDFAIKLSIMINAWYYWWHGRSYNALFLYYAMFYYWK